MHQRYLDSWYSLYETFFSNNFLVYHLFATHINITLFHQKLVDNKKMREKTLK